MVWIKVGSKKPIRHVLGLRKGEKRVGEMSVGSSSYNLLKATAL